MSKKSILCRRDWYHVVFPLLLCCVVGCLGCVEKPDEVSKPVPAAAGPGVTDSGMSPMVEPPSPVEATMKAEPVSEPEEPMAASVVPEPEMPQPPAATPVEPETGMSQEEPQPAEPDMAKDSPPVSSAKAKLDFGEPLVEGLGKNERLAPNEPIWLTKDRKSVVVQTMVCQREAPLELFACLLNSKEHESVLAVPVKAFFVHAGLLAAGAKPGTPVSWDPKYTPPTGTEIEITVLWKDGEGKIQKARAQDWVRDMTTGKAMTHPWVFAGSQMYKDEETGKESYVADSTGELICVSNFPSATLDVPIESSDSNAALMFETMTEKIPELGTPVTMVLTPKQNENASSEPPASSENK